MHKTDILMMTILVLIIVYSSVILFIRRQKITGAWVQETADGIRQLQLEKNFRFYIITENDPKILSGTWAYGKKQKLILLYIDTGKQGTVTLSIDRLLNGEIYLIEEDPINGKLLLVDEFPNGRMTITEKSLRVWKRPPK